MGMFLLRGGMFRDAILSLIDLLCAMTFCVMSCTVEPLLGCLMLEDWNCAPSAP